MAAKFVSKLVVSQNDVANSERLELALESLLCSLKVNDSVTDAMRLSLFTDLAQDEPQLRKCEEAEFPHQREMAKLSSSVLGVRQKLQVK